MRAPDVMFGPRDAPYMKRWWIRNEGSFDLSLHQLLRSDPDPALHDHRSDNISLILKGSYTEVIAEKSSLWPGGYDVAHPVARRRGPGSIIFRKAEQPHRLLIEPGKPVWTLWLKIKDRREWGFWVKDAIGGEYLWRHFKDYRHEVKVNT